MKKWPNIGDRMRQRLLHLGFVRDGKADVMRFALERGYHHVYLYRWIGGATPDYDNIIRLARDLETSPSWLMFGEAGTSVPVAPPTAERHPLTAAPSRRSGRGPRPRLAPASASPRPERPGVPAEPRTPPVPPRLRVNVHNKRPNPPYRKPGYYPWGPSEDQARAA